MLYSGGCGFFENARVVLNTVVPHQLTQITPVDERVLDNDRRNPQPMIHQDNIRDVSRRVKSRPMDNSHKL